MRKISLILLASMLLSVGHLFANEPDGPENPKKLSKQIWELLRENNIPVKDKDLKATVLFTISNQKELVVLAVEADNDELEHFIKGRLNYSKISIERFREGQRFIVPIRVTI